MFYDFYCDAVSTMCMCKLAEHAKYTSILKLGNSKKIVHICIFIFLLQDSLSHTALHN